MSEYISRESAIAIIEGKQKELCPNGRYGRGYVSGSDREQYDAWESLIDELAAIPDADVAEVTQCKNCCQSVMVDGVLHCTYWQKDTEESGYCHEGG